jgi:quercetin dioxygenase-like cupin family protein
VESVRSRLFEALAGPERYTLFAGDVARAFGVQLEHARAALRAIPEASAWRDGAIPGSQILVSPELAQRGTVIAKLPVGLLIPMHAHAERELTFVLDGELLDDGVRRVGPGELLDMPIGTSHAIEVAGEHACLAVFCRAPDRGA